MKDKIINITAGLFIIMSLIILAYNIGVNSVEPKEENQFFWDGDNCFSINSTVRTQRNLDENDSVFYTVIVTSEHDKQFIECFTDYRATAKEHKDALIMSLKDGIR